MSNVESIEVVCLPTVRGEEIPAVVLHLEDRTVKIFASGRLEADPPFSGKCVLLNRIPTLIRQAQAEVQDGRG